MSLHIAPGLELPDEAVTQTFAVLAKRGMGKTYLGMVMVEEMLKNNFHVVCVDPIGVHWGLRSSADGKSAGLPIVIAGGEHADVPIEPTSGEVLAELIVEQRVSMVIDLSLFRKGEQHRFMIDFAETLYRKNRQAIHLVLDEADEFAPQRSLGDEARMLGAIEDLVRRGRARGIGVTMITQRPAVLNKNVLTQIEVLIAMRLTSPQDRAAIAEWVKYHADNSEAQKMLESLGSLPVGTAWFWSPGWLDIFKKVAVRKRETLDSSSTPKVGEQRIEAVKVAEVDLGKLREQLSSTIQQVESNDPKVLRRRIAELEKQLEIPLEKLEPQIEVREVEVLPEGLKDKLVKLNTEFHRATVLFEEIVRQTSPMAAGNPHIPSTPPPISKGDSLTLSGFGKANGDYKVRDADGGELSLQTRLGAAEQKILTVLAQYPNGRTRRQLGVLSGYSIKSGYFTNTLSKLRSAGLMEGIGDDLRITETGIAAVGDFEAVPTGRQLIDYWLQRLGKAGAAMLEAAVAAYPEAISYDDIAERTGYSKTSGYFTNTLSKLRTLQLISGVGSVRASDVFFEEVRA